MPAGADFADCIAQEIQQVGDVGKILGYRVQDDGVKSAIVELTNLIRGALLQLQVTQFVFI